jgi:hypothetical protein
MNVHILDTDKPIDVRFKNVTSITTREKESIESEIADIDRIIEKTIALCTRIENDGNTKSANQWLDRAAKNDIRKEKLKNLLATLPVKDLTY